MMGGEECPFCGEARFDILEIPDWSEGKLSVTITCWGCELCVEGSLDFIPERFDRNCVGCNQDHRPVGKEEPKLCDNCDDKEIIENYKTFDLIIPGDTGKIHKNQTSGMACGNRWVEGKRIELEKPSKNEEKYEFENEWVDDGNLLYALQRANYNHDGKSANKIWNDIRRELWFEFEDIEEPEGEQSTTEAFRWIKITEITDDYREIPVENPEELLYEKVVLRYPNCD